MIALWNFYWPLLTVGMILGLATGWLAFLRPPAARPAILAGLAANIAAAALWHGPLGTGERLARTVETAARAELDRLEMGAVQARLRREPLRRTLVLAGPADDFQRSELPSYMREVYGVGDVRWAQPVKREAR